MQKQRAAPRVRIDFILIDHQVLFYVCLVVQSHISLYSFSVLVWKRSMLQLKKGKSKKGRQFSQCFTLSVSALHPYATLENDFSHVVFRLLSLQMLPSPCREHFLMIMEDKYFYFLSIMWLNKLKHTKSHHPTRLIILCPCSPHPAPNSFFNCAAV